MASAQYIFKDDVLIKKLKKCLKKEREKEMSQKEAPIRKVTCFECGTSGHVKSECIKLEKKNEFKSKKNKRPKKAYIARGNNEASMSSDYDNEVQALMASHNPDDDEVSNFDSNDKPSYNKLQNAFNELYEEFLKLSRKYSNQKKLILSLESEANNMKIELDQVKNSTCNKCQDHESKIVELNQVIAKYEKGQIGLDNVLSSQRFSNNKCRLGFSNFDKPNTSQTIFVKATRKFNNKESKKEHVVNPHKRPNDRNSFKSKNYSNIRNKSFNKNYSNARNNSNNFNSYHKPTCFYCNIIGHTSNACYIQNVGVPNGEFIWVEKGTNNQ
jgi:phage gpG-like protein